MTSPFDRRLLQVRGIADVAEARLDAFRCGDAELDRFLVADAPALERLAVARTHVAIVEDAVVGFVTTCADSVVLTQRERRGLADAAVAVVSIPAVKVARMGVDHATRTRVRGLGTQLMRYVALDALEVGEHIGCRLLTVDAYPEAVPFYEKLGFVRNASSEYKGRRNTSMRFDLHAATLPPWVFPGEK